MALIFLNKLSHYYELKCSVVIVAAGTSERMGRDKISFELGGKTVLERCVSAFENCEEVDEIVVVTRSEVLEQVADIIAGAGFKKVSKVVKGGLTRQESALIGVSELNSKTMLVAIHDGARPFVKIELIKALIDCASKHRSAIPVLPVAETVKICENGMVTGDTDRDKLFRVQTPQVFDKDILKGALTHCIEKNIAVTDDSSAVELMGFKPCTVEGDTENIKLTTPFDLLVGEAILKQRGEEEI